MTPRQRVQASLDHRQPDATPYHVTFTEPVRDAMRAYYGNQDFEAGLGNCLEIIRTGLPMIEVTGRPGIWQDEFGVQWDRTIDADIGTVCNQPVRPETLREFRFPDPHAPQRFAHFAPALEANAGRRFAIGTIGFTLFERAWTLAGMENVLASMVDDKGFVNELLDRILDFDLEVTRKALSYDIDGMRFGDDWGQQRGLIMGPVLWRELIKPRIARLYALVHAAGKRVFIHSCGKVDELFPDLIEVGVDVFNPFQPEVMDVEEMKRLHGERISFFGGISTQRTLPYGTVEQVRTEVRTLIRTVGNGGGYIAAPAHDIPKDAKPQNVAAMLEVLQTQ
ncbi:MAG TPA: uroporphyrinogen decarboxylase family protein [Spirochaetia bacterium]|nr:uroporphyrinogen decarboxylase family protein [Spirochaetia bacterium]